MTLQNNKAESINDTSHVCSSTSSSRTQKIPSGSHTTTTTSHTTATTPSVYRLASQDEAPEEILRAVADCLLQGGVAVLPTDSVYGLACAATPNNPAYQRIFDIKQRDFSQKLPWFLSSIQDLSEWGSSVSSWATQLAKTYWPGALTLVVHAAKKIAPEYVQAPPLAGAPKLSEVSKHTHALKRNEGRNPNEAPKLIKPTIALRVPRSHFLNELVRLTGPLAQTSANTHGMPAALSVETLEASIFSATDIIVDAGSTPLGLPSTIIDVTGDRPSVLRTGALAPKDVERIAYGLQVSSRSRP